jgi:tripartite-type tricarboxylate transporter receptor subunit TctC
VTLHRGMCAGVRVCVVMALMALGQGSAGAQAYPVKPVRIVVGYTAGGPVDIMARVLAPRLSAALGQQVVVDNRPGASGIIGAELVAKSPPDGHTLLMVSPTHAIFPSLFPNVTIDPERDFAPVSVAAAAPGLLLVVPSSFPVTTVRGLIDLARRRPDELVYGSSGSGGLPHLAAELFKTMSGVRMTHVPYKGPAPATVDLLAGQIPLMFNNILSAMPHVKTGRLRALGVTGAKRLPVVPEVPTISEAALAGYEVTGWYGMLAPRDTPKSVVSRLSEEVARAIASPEVVRRLADEGVEPVASTPEAFANLLREERAKWARVVKASGMKAD